MKIEHSSLIGTFEQKRNLVRQFNLMDDDFFAVVMQHEEAFEVMLRILTGRNDLHVTEVRTQYSIRNLVGHSVILDGYAEDDEHKLYNVEVQVKNNDYHPKRVRYYQSNIDLTNLEKGVKYKNLPDLYLIFITSFDQFGRNKNCYEVKRFIDGTNQEVSNGIHELYFNTAVKDDSEISKLLQYFENTHSGNTEFKELSDYVRYYKETEGGVECMCDAIRSYGDERAADAKAMGEAEKLVQLICILMDNTKCSLEDALNMTGCSVEEYNSSVSLLNSIKNTE